MIDTPLRKFLQRKPTVGIFGAGLSGKGAAHLCEALHLSYELCDEKKGHSTTPHFQDYGICIVSPGFSPQHPWRQQAQDNEILCIPELDFAATCFSNSLVAVTGTNGKTSVTEIVAQLLRENGEKALSVGNNGTVLSEAVASKMLPDEGTYVCEVSSFQAASLQFLRPTYTLWTNIAPDHLNYHGSFQNYFSAKAHLLELTQKACFCGHSLQLHKADFPAPLTCDLVFAPSIDQEATWLHHFPACFSHGQQKNFLLVRTFAQALHIPEKTLHTCLENFQQPPHRLHCCRRIGETTFWNDSKGTNLHAVQAALESVKHLPHLCWILGGGGKGEDLSSFIQTFRSYPIQTIYLIGETGQQLATRASEFHASIVVAGCLENVFRQLPQQEPFALVLSPGFTSWDQFSSFEERGQLFEQLAQNYRCKA